MTALQCAAVYYAMVLLCTEMYGYIKTKYSHPGGNPYYLTVLLCAVVYYLTVQLCVVMYCHHQTKYLHPGGKIIDVAQWAKLANSY